MKVLRAEFNTESRKDTITIVPIGDVHIGAAACDEKRLQNVIDRVKNADYRDWETDRKSVV